MADPFADIADGWPPVVASAGATASAGADSPPTAGAPAPSDARAPAPPTAPRRALLAAALILGTAGAALPALILLWLVFALLATAAAAEALEQTGGLVPTTFGGGFWLALGADVAALVWSLIRRLRGRRAPFRPMVVLVAALSVLVWTCVPLHLAGVGVPDIAPAVALLGAHHLIIYLLPVVLALFLSRGLRQAWGAGGGSTVSTARVSAYAACLGGAGVSVLLALALAGQGGYVGALGPGVDDLQAVWFGGVEARRRTLASISAEAGEPPPARYAAAVGAGDADAFAACAEAVAGAREDGRALPAAAAGALVRAGLDAADAADAVAAALLRVCAREDGGAEAEHAAAFRREAMALPGVACEQVPAPTGLPGGEATCAVRDGAALAAVRDAYGRLEPAQQLAVMLRYVDGRELREVADRLGVREATARGRAARALDRLRRVWERRRAPAE